MKLGSNSKGLGPLGALLATAVVLAACASQPETPGNQPGAPQTSTPGEGQAVAVSEPVTITGVFCACFANVYVAYELGFFEDEGVPVREVISTRGGADTFQALAGGQTEFGLIGLDAGLRGQAEGVDIALVGTISPEFYALSVRQELAGEIESPADLVGRKVSVSRVGSSSWGFLSHLLTEEGASIDDVEVVQLGAIDTTMAGLRQGTVDAAITWEPGTSEGIRDGYAEVLLDSLDPEDHETMFGSTESIQMALATTQGFLTDNPEAVRAVLRAIDKANAWIAEHSAEEIAEVVAPMAPGLDEDLLVSAMENTKANLPGTTAVPESAYQDSAERLVEAGIIETVPDLEEAFACDIAECAA